MRPEVNWTDYLESRDNKAYFISDIEPHQLYNPDNWKFVEEFNHLDHDGSYFFFRFGFVYVGPRHDRHNSSLVFTLPTDYKLRDNNDMIDRRKNILCNTFIEVLESKQLLKYSDLIYNDILDEYVRKPYASGGNLE